MNKLKDRCNRIVSRLENPQHLLHPPTVLASIFAAFFITTVIFIKTSTEDFTDLEFVKTMNVPVFAAIFAALTAVVLLGCVLLTAKRVLPAVLVASVTAFGFVIHPGGERNIFLGIGAAVMAIIVCQWIFNHYDRPFSGIKFGYKIGLAILVVLVAAHVVYMSIMGWARVRSFTYNTFDFGIFAQMFAYMKETGLPLTTVERGYVLSHFAVHFSPFFYVLLPGYMIFDTPVYLCVMQALFVALGTFAVYGIAKELGFSPKQSVLAGIVYLLYPAFTYGLHFDFHENKFLTFCIVYTIYFLLKRKWIPFYIFAILLCTVKEDAPIYLAAIALFMLFHEKQYKHGTITMVLAVAYFIFAVKMIQVCGAEEEMQFGWRYGNFDLGEGADVGSVVKVTLLNFGYAFKEIFQQEKLEYLLWMFLPVLFTPFVTRKVSTLFLLMPMVLLNLMTNWQFQYDVDYQYTYGTGGLIIACALLTLIQLPPKTRNSLLLCMAMVCVVVTVPRTIARNNSYIGGYLAFRDMFDESIVFMDETLPKDAAIGAEGDVMPLLYDCPNVTLDPREHNINQCEYWVAKAEDGDIPTVLEYGVELYAENGFIQIYKNPHYVAAQ